MMPVEPLDLPVSHGAWNAGRRRAAGLHLRIVKQLEETVAVAI
jgi:hypothetical protein